MVSNNTRIMDAKYDKFITVQPRCYYVETQTREADCRHPVDVAEPGAQNCWPLKNETNVFLEACSPGYFNTALGRQEYPVDEATDRLF